jgi:hypothetical protein
MVPVGLTESRFFASTPDTNKNVQSPYVFLYAWVWEVWNCGARSLCLEPLTKIYVSNWYMEKRDRSKSLKAIDWEAKKKDHPYCKACMELYRGGFREEESEGGCWKRCLQSSWVSVWQNIGRGIWVLSELRYCFPLFYPKKFFITSSLLMVSKL